MGFSAEFRGAAVALAEEVGTAEAARRVGVTARTINRWQPPSADRSEKTAEARAGGAQRIATQWADYRSKEAAAAGATANRLRREIVARLEAGQSGNDLRSLAIAYGILVDKAELLSDRATQRIEMWAESELDRELRSLISQVEDRVREHG